MRKMKGNACDIFVVYMFLKAAVSGTNRDGRATWRWMSGKQFWWYGKEQCKKTENYLYYLGVLHIGMLPLLN
jgi:hypothetical protein